MVFLGNILSIWTSNGIFDVALPLVLFFAIIFSILHRTKILGDNKSIDAVVSLILSLFMILNPLTAHFLAQVFSQTAIALIILVASLIIMGLFTEKSVIGDRAFKWIGILAGTVFFIWIVILLNDTYGFYNWYQIGFYGITWPDIIFGVLVIGAMIFIVKGTEDKPKVSKA